jgi:hypothetical protein
LASNAQCHAWSDQAIRNNIELKQQSHQCHKFCVLQGPTVTPVYSVGNASNGNGAEPYASLYSVNICVPKNRLYKSIKDLRAVRLPSIRSKAPNYKSALLRIQYETSPSYQPPAAMLRTHWNEDGGALPAQIINTVISPSGWFM